MVNNCSRNYRAACLVICLSLFPAANPQENSGCDLKFIGHLIKSGYFEEVLFILDSTDCSVLQMNDSADYFRGWSLFSLNSPEASSESLLKIPATSPFYSKSHFYAAFNYTRTGDYDLAKAVISGIEVNSEFLIALKNYEIAGIDLASGNQSGFDNWINAIRPYQPILKEPSGNLLRISDEMKNHKVKSPLVAGMLSGILPGAGKLYAGRKGEAAAMFLSNVTLGLVTYENYRKSGPGSFRTIAFGSLLAITYIANIYGSVFSVSVNENDYRKNYKNAILFNLRVPLDTFFR